MQGITENNEASCICAGNDITPLPRNDTTLVDKEIERLFNLWRENKYFRQAISSMLQSGNQAVDINIKIRKRRVYGVFYTLGSYSE